MAVFFYAPKLTVGADKLMENLEAKRLTKFDGLRFWAKGKQLTFTSDDVIICWGACVPQLNGPRMLNAHPFHVTQLMLNTKMDTINHSARFTRLFGLVTSPLLSQYQGGYPRRLDDPAQGPVVTSTSFPGYGSPSLNFNTEYKIHLFKGKPIYVESKEPTLPVAPKLSLWREGYAHPKTRSSELGWRSVQVDPTSIPYIIAELQTVVTAIGLDFGCYYVGLNGKDLKTDGLNAVNIWKILSGPKLTSKELVEVYTKHIKEWIG